MRVRIKRDGRGRRLAIPGISSSEFFSEEECVCAVLSCTGRTELLLSDAEGIPILVSADLVEVIDNTVPADWRSRGPVDGTDVVGAIGYPYLMSSDAAWNGTFELRPEARAKLAEAWMAQQTGRP